MIKVPRFYNQKGKETSAAPPPTVRNPPVVMIHIGKPSLEIIRSKKESTNNTQ